MAEFLKSDNQSIRKQLSEITQKHLFNQIEIGSLSKPITIDFYEKWLAKNQYGTMTYLKEHLPFKKNPLLLKHDLKSIISVAQSYYPSVQPNEALPARLALYAQNDDYHYWLKNKLNQVIEDLKLIYPDETFLPYVDSGPILERDWAYQNRLGWFGKNTCLIHPQHGSLFFIAEIFSSLQLKPDSPELLEPLPDFCGKCQKCIEICPTNAIIEPRILKADQCISYLTIEAKTTPPVELRKKMGDWFFGCDLCQTVCPWNEKVFKTQSIFHPQKTNTQLLLNLTDTERSELVLFFKWILTSSNKQIQKRFLGSPLSRASAKGLKRNALIVIANKNLYELKETILQFESKELEELKTWTLEQLTS